MQQQLWDVPTQLIGTVLPIQPTNTLQQRLIAFFALCGASIVISLYLLIPLLVLLGQLHDWLIQLLIAAILLTASELGICSILVNTSKGVPVRVMIVPQRTNAPIIQPERLVLPRMSLPVKR